MKPLASENMVTREGKHFCCNNAAQQYFASDAQYQDYLAQEKKGGFGRLVKKFIVFVFLLALVGAAAFYFLGDKGGKQLEQLKEKATELSK